MTSAQALTSRAEVVKFYCHLKVDKKRQQFKVYEAVHSYVQPKMIFVSKALTFLKQQSLSAHQTRPVTSTYRLKFSKEKKATKKPCELTSCMLLEVAESRHYAYMSD